MSDTPKFSRTASKTRGNAAEKFLRQLPDYLAPEGTSGRDSQLGLLRHRYHKDSIGTQKRDIVAAEIRAARKPGGRDVPATQRYREVAAAIKAASDRKHGTNEGLSQRELDMIANQKVKVTYQTVDPLIAKLEKARDDYSEWRSIYGDRTGNHDRDAERQKLKKAITDATAAVEKSRKVESCGLPDCPAPDRLGPNERTFNAEVNDSAGDTWEATVVYAPQDVGVMGKRNERVRPVVLRALDFHGTEIDLPESEVERLQELADEHYSLGESASPVAKKGKTDSLWSQYVAAKAQGFDGTFSDWKEIQQAERQWASFKRPRTESIPRFSTGPARPYKSPVDTRSAQQKVDAEAERICGYVRKGMRFDDAVAKVHALSSLGHGSWTLDGATLASAVRQAREKCATPDIHEELSAEDAAKMGRAILAIVNLAKKSDGDPYKAFDDAAAEVRETCTIGSGSWAQVLNTAWIKLHDCGFLPDTPIPPAQLPP